MIEDDEGPSPEVSILSSFLSALFNLVFVILSPARTELVEGLGADEVVSSPVVVVEVEVEVETATLLKFLPSLSTPVAVLVLVPVGAELICAGLSDLENDWISERTSVGLFKEPHVCRSLSCSVEFLNQGGPCIDFQ